MQKCIDKNFKPVTKDDLIHKFSQLGIKRGDTLLVHASLSSLGYVVGGAEALYLALREVIGIEGTIVVPSQTVEISDPASWQYPPVPDEWHAVIRDAMPAYSKKLSYSKAMGAFSQFIGIFPNSIRSNHPMYSFTSIHLAENRLNREVIQERSKIWTKDGEKWISFKNIELDLYDDYLEIQNRFMENHLVAHTTINEGTVYIFDMKECVDFAQHYYQIKE